MGPPHELGRPAGDGALVLDLRYPPAVQRRARPARAQGLGLVLLAFGHVDEQAIVVAVSHDHRGAFLHDPGTRILLPEAVLGVDVVQHIAQASLLLGPHLAHAAIHGGEKGLHALSHTAEVRIGVHTKRIEAVVGALGKTNLRRPRNRQIAVHVEDVDPRNVPATGLQHVADHLAQGVGLARAGHPDQEGVAVHQFVAVPHDRDLAILLLLSRVDTEDDLHQEALLPRSRSAARFAADGKPRFKSSCAAVRSFVPLETRFFSLRARPSSARLTEPTARP